MTRLLAAIALMTVLAGCAAAPPSGERADASSIPATNPTGTGAPPTTTIPPPGAPAWASPWEMGFAVHDARNPRAFVLVDKTAAQALLPIGWTAADAHGALNALMPEAAPIIPSLGMPLALAVFDTQLSHPISITSTPPGHDTADMMEVGWSIVGIFVEPPNLGVPYSPGKADLLGLATLWSDERAANLFADLGFGPDVRGPVQVDPGFAHDPGPVQGKPRVVDGSGEFLSWDFAIGPATGNRETEDVRVNFWWANDKGTMFLENHVAWETRGGDVTACYIRPGTLHARATQVEAGTCTEQDRMRFMANIGDHTEAHGPLVWMPGVLAG